MLYIICTVYILNYMKSHPQEHHEQENSMLLRNVCKCYRTIRRYRQENRVQCREEQKDYWSTAGLPCANSHYFEDTSISGACVYM